MGRVRVFAAPFVITAALSGCKQADDDAASKPPPRTKPDAAMSRNPPMPMPDAQLISVNPPTPADAAVVVELLDAKAGAIVYGDGGACFTGYQQAVKCPKGGAPFVVAALEVSAPGGRITLQEGQLACYQDQPLSCPEPPPGVAMSCNPPGPTPIECPDELMPRLRRDLEPERKDGKCTYQGVQVRCP